jgi:AAA15 family ATPase/GTPase
MVAEGTKFKRGSNTFEAKLNNDDQVQLVTSSVIFGPNASGKSNFIKAFANFKGLITHVGRLADGTVNPLYNPYLFDVNSRQEDTRYECTFVLGEIKYHYSISFNHSNITSEELVFFPKKVKKLLFKRLPGTEGDLADTIRLTKDVKEIDLKLFPEHFKVFKDQVVLSKFGSDIPDKFLNSIYNYFKNSWQVWSENNSHGIEMLKKAIINSSKTDQKFKNSFFHKVGRLIMAADTKIDGLVLKEQKANSSSNDSLTGNFGAPDEISKVLYGTHKVYDNNIAVSSHDLLFNEESAGTNVMFALGAFIFIIIKAGGIFFVDELDNSLHPKVARFLVSLFSNNRINKKNAQIIFTTHEAHLIDKDMFRSDQIWFTEKDDQGKTTLFSAQDFEGIREDIPFDKWYLAGKFGALPNIMDVEDIFNDGDEGK